MSNAGELIRAELARQGVAITDDDLDVIVKIVTTNRAALAKAQAAVTDEPDVPQGFVPPAPPVDDATPHAGR